MGCCVLQGLVGLVCPLIGTKQSIRAAFHPESDGQTERVDRVLEDMLCHNVSAEQKDCSMWLDSAEFAYNNAWHSSVQETPFLLNYGQHSNTPFLDQTSSRSGFVAPSGLDTRSCCGEHIAAQGPCAPTATQNCECFSCGCPLLFCMRR